MKADVTSLLACSPGHRVAVDLVARIAEEVGAEAELWLADYRQSRLIGLLGGDDVAVDDSWLGRCFAGQAAVTDHGTDQGRTAVPVSTRGNRVGVLTVESGDVDLDDLTTACTLLAQAVAAIGSSAPVYESTRRRQPMTVAAELQWALLPGQSYADDDITLAALLEPAYSVAGDCYDWSRDDDGMTVAVLDGTGRGVPAALATTLTLGALRNAAFSAPSLADRAALTDQAVYAHHGGETFTSALLLRFDARTGQARVVDAGSPHLFRLRDGRAEQLELEAQLPLGMFEETLYVEQDVDVRPGDRLLVVSDGVHGSLYEGGPTMPQALRETRLLSPAEVCRHVLRRLRQSWTEDGPRDDAVVVCLDWHPRVSVASG